MVEDIGGVFVVNWSTDYQVTKWDGEAYKDLDKSIGGVVQIIVG